VKVDRPTADRAVPTTSELEEKLRGEVEVFQLLQQSYFYAIMTPARAINDGFVNYRRACSTWASAE